MTRSWSLLWFVCLALVAPLSSCRLLSPAPQPQWVEAELPCSSEQVLREVVTVSLQRSGFPVGSGIDPGARRVATGWRESAHAFKGKGWREKATVEYEPSEAGRFGIRIRVERETNESLRPLDPAYAKWKPSADHPPSGQKILQYMRSMLDSSFEVGEATQSPFAR